MFDTALTVNDLVFLAKGAGMTIFVTAISVFFGTILGIVFGVVRHQVGPWWAAPLTFVLDLPRDAVPAHPGHHHQKPARYGQIGGQRRPLRAHALLGDLHDDFLPAAETPLNRRTKMTGDLAAYVFRLTGVVGEILRLYIGNMQEPVLFQAEIDKRSAELRQRLPQGQAVSVVRWNPQGPVIMSSHLFVGQLLNDLGLRANELAAAQAHKPHSDVLSLENLSRINADWIFLATLNPDGRKALEDARKQPAFTRLSAVADGHVVTVDGQIWSSSSGYLAAQQVLDDVEKALLD